MKKWKSIWGYRALDFAAFPITIVNQREELLITVLSGGEAFKVRFQNTYGKKPLKIAAAWIETINVKTDIFLNKEKSFIINPGSRAWSDPVPVETVSGQKIKIILEIEEAEITSACTFLENNLADVSYVPFEKKEKSIIKSDFLIREPLHRCVIGVDQAAVLTDREICTVVAFGDSITHMSRWTVPLSERFLREKKGGAVLLNLGICGNRLLHDASHGSGHGGWFGESGLKRFERDVFQNDFIPDSIILLEGINDILHPAIGEAPPEEFVSPEQIIEGLEKCAETAHSYGVPVCAATLLPFRGCKDHWRIWHEEKRCKVNRLLKESKAFDVILDFDRWSRDPKDFTKLDETGGSEDRLHPGVEGGKRIAEQINLEMICSHWEGEGL